MMWTIGWVLLFGLGFALEGAAFFNRDRGATLSQHVWSWFSLKGKSRGWRARRFAFLTFWAWLTIHFFTGGWV